MLEKQRKDNRTDVAIVRLEQLYPIAQTQMDAVVKKYAQAEFYWVQEEPANMGAWYYILSQFNDTLPLKLVARKTSASPATGYNKAHVKEQAALVEKAFG